ncbi:hypothetical protein [Lacticaseibacillus absianus]|uniref:hypothetical protein n=1 Tax=Lacticaseibacillus absianus TaxID=2729623 RepID=UPI0015CE56F0|nr:hypothetical protein [Lacticaseibacillus absianus]
MSWQAVILTIFFVLVGIVLAFLVIVSIIGHHAWREIKKENDEFDREFEAKQSALDAEFKAKADDYRQMLKERK